jgi:hypothetical protein
MKLLRWEGKAQGERTAASFDVAGKKMRRSRPRLSTAKTSITPRESGRSTARSVTELPIILERRCSSARVAASVAVRGGGSCTNFLIGASNVGASAASRANLSL